MADGSFMTIVGADGNFMSPDEGRLMMLVQGIEDGSFGGEMYEVGAQIANLVRAQRPASPALARFSRLAINPALAGRLAGAMRGAAPTPIQTTPAPQRVETTPVGAVREVVQGLDTGPTLVLAGASFPITFNASMLFEPTRLMIGPSVAPLFVIEDIRVAADSLFLSAGAVPGEVYLPDGVGSSALKRRTAQPGTPISVIVTNIDGAPQRFRGALFGAGADACR